MLEPPSPDTAIRPSAWAPFHWPEFRRLLAGSFCATLAARALLVVLGYEVYKLTGHPLALGILGLVEAIPALSLALFAGHVADRHDRRWILRTTLGTLVLCGVALAIVEVAGLGTAKLFALFAIVFVAGIAKGFSDPAAAALEAQVVPWEMLIHSSTVMASCWMTGAVL
jgi:MFS family permease